MTFMKCVMSLGRIWLSNGPPPRGGGNGAQNYPPCGRSRPTIARAAAQSCQCRWPRQQSSRSANESRMKAVNEGLPLELDGSRDLPNAAKPPNVRHDKTILRNRLPESCGKAPTFYRKTMTPRPSISFSRHAAPKKGSVVLLSAEGGGLGEVAKGYDPGNALGRAFAVADFSGKSGSSTVEVIAPQGSSLDRLVALGVGKPANLKEYDWLKIGGSIAAQFRKSAEVAVVLDLPDPGDPRWRRGSRQPCDGHPSQGLQFRQVQDQEGRERRQGRRAEAVEVHHPVRRSRRQRKKHSPTPRRWPTASSWRAIL